MTSSNYTLPIPRFLRHTRATQEEIMTPSPADALIPRDCDRWVRCITIDAPVKVVFRWLCQLTVAPYSFDSIDFPGRRSPRELTPGTDKLHIGQHFLIFTITDFAAGSHITGISRPEFARRYGNISVSYTVTQCTEHHTRLRANACVSRSSTTLGVRRLVLAAGDKLMAGRQLRVIKALSESTQVETSHQ